ncbi:hypothetical protein M527_10950 [Sphingobium indicum IP26]|uniref:Uncharacterized protein n=1 Tax=Sphingobium indicum F2 TaxID=1450518 RepID=A0A8E0WSF2_9SPHN|nr:MULTISPECIES: hypothetical protein [Sphingobium]EPR18918.1 hypothetical protein M527_10950 [Sphingobium indicum IP26]KER36360.1 hypothetical protein AL00_11000 [Sphingobium indicum F2]
MAWDLRRALLKKGEFESARLIDFEFRERARTMKLLAPRVSAALEPQALAGEIALGDDESILRRLLDRFPALEETALRRDYAECRAQARKELIAELGDPTPYRLG